MKNMKFIILIPKNIGIGAKVVINVPIRIRSYELYFVCTGAKKMRKTIMRTGASEIYKPKGASYPSS